MSDGIPWSILTFLRHRGTCCTLYISQRFCFCIQAFCIWKHSECWAFRPYFLMLSSGWGFLFLISGGNYVSLESVSSRWHACAWDISSSAKRIWTPGLCRSLQGLAVLSVFNPLVSYGQISEVKHGTNSPLLGWACNKTDQLSMMVSRSRNQETKQSFTIFQDSLEKTFRNPYKHTHTLLAVSFVPFTLAIKRSLSRISSPLSVQKCLKKSIYS